MNDKLNTSQSLATAITKSASKQTYYTIRFFVDRGLVADAYRAYGYFRWLDDILDAGACSRAENIAFVNRQKTLLEAGYRGEMPEDLCAEEWMLMDLICNDTEKNSGLQTYLRNMMEVMIFDASRRGQVISQAELSEYSLNLATAVTEAMHYFIGHDDPVPRDPTRYLAVTAAHITHMLRDTFEDTEAGYFNVPGEVLRMRGISPQQVKNRAYQGWVCGRIQLARGYFKAGREYLAQVKNWRCRLAGYAYTARFEWMLRTIERDSYCLRSEYPERKSLRVSLWMGWSTLASMLSAPWVKAGTRTLVVQPVQVDKR
jgi:phytoene/squalene synthetase